MGKAECCHECIKWEQFKEGCWVHWEGKKDCTQKVTSVDDIPLE